VVMQWNELWNTSRPVLQVYDDGDVLRFIDTRPCAVQRSWTISGLEAEVYRLCDSAQAIAQLRSNLGDAVEPAIDTLLTTKVSLRMDDKLLSLAVNQS